MGICLFDVDHYNCFFFVHLYISGNEILFGVGNNLGTRQNFLSLCPNKPIREEVYSCLYRKYPIVYMLQIGVKLYDSKFVIQLLADYTLHGSEGCLQPTIPHKECLVYAPNFCGMPYIMCLFNTTQILINIYNFCN